MRTYWTLYDDDSRDWDVERERVEAELRSARSLRRLLRRYQEELIEENVKKDHFQEDDELFQL